MKSERRHELQRNALADWLERSAERIQPYTNLILAIAVLATLLVAVVLWWRRSEAQEATQAWDAMYAAMASGDAKAVDDVAEAHQGDEVGQWAAAIAGDMHLATGSNELFTNKANAVQELQKAVENYLGVLDRSSDAVLRERATFGLARAYESLAGTRQSQGELSKALEQYRKLLEQWPQGTYAAAAQQRLRDLEKPSTKTFYDQFAAYDPKPALTPSGNIPFDQGALGTGQPVPDFSKILGAEGESKPAAGQAPSPDSVPADPVPADIPANQPGAGQADAGQSAATATPAASATPPADKPEDKPAASGDKPASKPNEPAAEKPVTEKPVTEKPVTEKP